MEGLASEAIVLGRLGIVRGDGIWKRRAANADARRNTRHEP